MRVLFVDRDGTLVEEPADNQVDRLDKIRFVSGAFAALRHLQDAGYTLVMVTNQDGLGTSSFPTEDFTGPQQFILDAYASQGVHFREVFICPHKPSDGCACRKPNTALVADWITANAVDLQRSAVIGDRETDLEFARRLGCAAHRIRSPNEAAGDWATAVRELTSRRARVSRRTRETSIDVAVDLDHVEPLTLSTGIGFFDHMLEQLGKHGGFSLELRCVGDLQVDEHHTVEDCALALGQALREALGDKRGIARYGFLLPMDEARVQVAIDLSGRSHFVFEGKFTRETVGQLPTELVPHFFRSLADALGAAVHVSVTGDNAHHMVEACFKGVGRALRMALRREGDDLPSTKGVL
jgi:imidazoleglycerol-phosphate dehydratase/histidinol-phosphatase